MKVPPLITAAVSATANAPSERLPRKYFVEEPRLAAGHQVGDDAQAERDQGEERQGDQGRRVGVDGVGLIHAGRPSRMSRSSSVGVVGPQVVVDHEPAGEDRT